MTLDLYQSKVTEVWIENLRTLEKVRLSLKGLTVLIGDNGTGKSSILEACELLHAASAPKFLKRLHEVHGGLAALLRHGAQRLKLGVRIEGLHEVYDLKALEYEFVLLKDNGSTIVEEELMKAILEDGGEKVILEQSRTRNVARALAKSSDDYFPIEAQQLTGDLLLPTLGIFSHVAATVMIHALEGIQVHLPFDVMSAWGARSQKRTPALHGSPEYQEAENLYRFGGNFAAVFEQLKKAPANEWETTLEYVRLGLGDHVEDIDTAQNMNDGSLFLLLRYAGEPRPIPSTALSDGTLAYLAFVALYRLAGARSLLCFDEPELHLHPNLLMRVLDMFESMAYDQPVLIATHSDRLLDGLTNPAESVLWCELDERRATKLIKPNKEALDRWLARYRGIGDLRASGHVASVMAREE